MTIQTKYGGRRTEAYVRQDQAVNSGNCFSFNERWLSISVSLKNPHLQSLLYHLKEYDRQWRAVISVYIRFRFLFPPPIFGVLLQGLLGPRQHVVLSGSEVAVNVTRSWRNHSSVMRGRMNRNFGKKQGKKHVFASCTCCFGGPLDAGHVCTSQLARSDTSGNLATILRTTSQRYFGKPRSDTSGNFAGILRATSQGYFGKPRRDISGNLAAILRATSHRYFGKPRSDTSAKRLFWLGKIYSRGEFR